MGKSFKDSDQEKRINKERFKRNKKSKTVGFGYDEEPRFVYRGKQIKDDFI